MRPLEMMVFAIDFDGTCVTHAYPEVGADAPLAVEVMKGMVERGASLILWTMRSGKTLEDAEAWFKERGIPLYASQRNPMQEQWTSSPKCYAHVYIDDAAFGCPMNGNVVDWSAVGIRYGVLKQPEGR